MSYHTRTFWLFLLVLFVVACTSGESPAPTATPTAPPATPLPTKIPAITPAAFSQPALPDSVESASVQTIVDDACAALVIDTLTTLEAACTDLSGNSVCFGHAPLVVRAAPEVALAQAGDVAPLSLINTIRTAPVNVSAAEWGTALVRIQPDEADGWATVAMVGDVTLHKQTADGQQLTIQTSADAPACPGAPNQAIIQTDTTVSLTVNGVTLDLTDAIVAVRAVPNGEMEVIVLRGTVVVSAEGVSQTVGMGQMTTIPLGGDDGLTAVGPPTPPVAFDPALIQFLPFYIGLDLIDIPAGERWASTDIALEAGQSFIVIAAGLVKTIDYMPWSSPEGHPPSDCAAVGRGDWDCKCRTLPEWGRCSLDEVASMTLLARIEEGTPIIVRSGGVFTAKESGTLQLGVNDNHFDDNVASFHAVIVALDFDPNDE